MNQEQEKQYQEVRERVAELIYYWAEDSSKWDWQGEGNKEWYMHKYADPILQLPAIRIEDADQRLPENPYPPANNEKACLADEAFKMGQKSMAGFVRVLPRE
jgi:hypothetical protein